MFVKHISWLRCVSCGGEVALKAGEIFEDCLYDGVLCCLECDQLYPVLGGAPVMFSRKSHHCLNEAEVEIMNRFKFPIADYGFVKRTKNHREKQQIAVEENWEYQWEKLYPFTVQDLNGAGLFGSDAFKNFLPLTPESVKGATILVGGAGRGREVYHLSQMGAKTIIAVDLGREILGCRELIAEGSEAELLLLRSDLVELPLGDDLVDISICDHALQHIHDHKQGYAELARVCKQNGQVAICVYSWESNFIMTHLVEPAKVILHRIPLPVLFFLSLFPSLVLQFFILFFYVPLAKLSKDLVSRLPLHEHLLFWSQNRFKTTWMGIFDLFHAPISYHFKREEVEKLACENDLNITLIHHTNGVLWSMIAEKQEKKIRELSRTEK